MKSVKILHNPRCSKSRQALALLQEADCEVDVIEYLKHPLSTSQLSDLFTLLNLKSPRDMMRVKEVEYKEQNLNNPSLSNDVLLSAMAHTPKLIERPIIITAKAAIIARPPEKVQDIL